MFTWVCQRCGKEVDVSEVECPHCAAEVGRTELGSAHGAKRGPFEDELPIEKLPAPRRTAGPAVADTLPPPAGRASRPPLPEPLPPPPHAFAVRPIHLLLFGLVLIVSLGGAVYLARPDLMAVEGVSLPKLPKLSASEAAPLQGGPIEVAGIRAWRDQDAKLRVRAVLVNHTAGVHPELRFHVSLRDPKAEEGDAPAATFEVELEKPLGARESREIETDLDAPEGLTALPDWNRVSVQLQDAPSTP